MSRNVFNTTPIRKQKRNRFSLSHDLKYSTDMGLLCPTFIQEVLPGDSFRISTETLIRFAPMVAPVMHNITVFMHYFFVPNRIVWENWEQFISADLSKETPPAWPHFRISNVNPVGSIADYMGIPTGVQPTTLSALPMAAYAKVFNEYYRDQNLVDPVTDELNDGDNSANGDLLENFFGQPFRRAWQHDYFTAALPFAQKGPAVEIPVGNFQDVDIYLKDDIAASAPRVVRVDGEPVSQQGVYLLGNRNDVGPQFDPDFVSSPQESFDDVRRMAYDPRGTLAAATSELEAGAATINDLRTAFQLQKFFELAARGGSRYVEQLKVHWNVTSSDARLNRPEFLGGSRLPVIISEVLQTSESSDTPQATMAGHGISAARGKTVRYYAEEHGYIIGIQSVMPNTAYQQGIPRHFSRQSWEDYAWPTFAHLGEQAILNKELYIASTPNSADEDTFGYIPRYSEYRYTPSRVAGDFRDNLAFWHLGRIFSNRPALNREFIEANPRKDIFAVTDPEDQSLWCHSFHNVMVKRALPKYGVPTL